MIGQSTPARLVSQAKIVLAAAEGRENTDIAQKLDCEQETVGRWRNRFVALRLAGDREGCLSIGAACHGPVRA